MVPMKLRMGFRSMYRAPIFQRSMARSLSHESSGVNWVARARRLHFRDMLSVRGNRSAAQ